MRKMTTGLAISLDGVAESPANWGGFGFITEEMNEMIGAGIAQADAILLGRRTYVEFAELWPKQGSEVPMADFLNNTPKYVVSRTLKRLTWGPAKLLTGDLADAVIELKGQPAKISRSLEARRWCNGCSGTGCSMSSPSWFAQSSPAPAWASSTDCAITWSSNSSHQRHSAAARWP